MPADPMRVLAVLYCYPPLLVPASICYLKLVAGLRAAGVDVEIVTIRPDSFQAPGAIPLDASLEAVVPGGVVNHAVRSPERSPWLKLAKRLDATRRFTYRWLEPKKREWIGPALRHLRAQDLGRFDVLLTCSQPHANHLLGLALQEETGLPWVAYFSDPWTDNPYAWFPVDAVREHHRRLEDEVLRRADRVLYTCDEMRDLVLSRHDALEASRTGVLPHAFVEAWYETAKPPEPEGPSAGLRLLQTGSFYGPRSILPFVEALATVGASRELRGALRVDSYGGMPPEQRQAIAERGLGDVFHVGGFLPYLQTLALMRTSDALLLVDAPLTSTEESVFLPSKLVDYLGSGKPVFALTPERGTTARVLEECGGRICPVDDPQRAAAMLAEGLDDAFETHRPRPDAVAPYDHREVGRALRGQLETVASKRSAAEGATR